jgi:hypothetical protein
LRQAHRPPDAAVGTMAVREACAGHHADGAVARDARQVRLASRGTCSATSSRGCTSHTSRHLPAISTVTARQIN